ncbi:30S ribosomal protein S17 [Parachlamydia sp.]|uniref:30S ribosomal protein S17 n=1 Tax=Parachlamydia sp. TaxID=2052048 RepID=UPI003D0FAB20
MEEIKSKRKVKTGTVLSNKMEKTVVVQVSRTYPHPRYGKVVTRNKKYYAHNELRPLEVGEQVTIEETRPLSKLKRWRVVA